MTYLKQSIDVMDSECDEMHYSSAKSKHLKTMGMSVTQSVGLSKVPKMSQHKRDHRSDKSDSMPGSKKLSRVHSTEIDTNYPVP